MGRAAAMGPAILGSQAAAEHARPEPGQTAESEAELSSEQVREQDANGGGGGPESCRRTKAGAFGAAGRQEGLMAGSTRVCVGPGTQVPLLMETELN